MNLKIDSLGVVTLSQAEPIRELHLHVHEGVSEEVLVQRLDTAVQAITTRFDQMEENTMGRLDDLNTKVDALTAGVENLATKSVDVVNAVNSEQEQISAAMDELRALANDNPALQPALDKLDASLATIGTASDALTGAISDIKSTIPDAEIPPVENPPAGGGDTGTGGEVPPDDTGAPEPPVVPGGDLNTPA